MLDLTAADIQSPTWHKLAAHYRERLIALREGNDKRQEHDDTEYLRGRIQEIKTFLDLPPNPKRLYVGENAHELVRG